mmetsp:Transcript_23971/g.48364  ORF Transcript_23971/g.48364 Transcript_23971/m.48364 type:complete len:404 (+) Transcript_23971:136-1347(+)|eukprot:CAMPEP_0181317926 /NCGR_PEP_ID=MMETSP1101-20121128/16730_1 /TAXON_ID=46948 /ORGANISM="Rhodomonas abbreviata, Strain Caron Lab Isolate" /LENGTH=403 /DNA_ID=CAMNT_0023425355 /DNA_START=136 /DNA_END=1347 /DNA_ORIENTATION=+
MVCVDKCSDGAVGICRLTQAVIACLFLFIGITCQFYAGLNVNDVPLSNLCETYSGSGDAMDLVQFNKLFDWVERETCKSSLAEGMEDPPCCMSRNPDCINYDSAAGFFLSANMPTSSDRVDLLRYAGPYFWCKYVPAEAVNQAPNATCWLKMQANPMQDPQPCKVWPEQEAEPNGAANWYLAPGNVRGAIFHINCNDKLQVYKAFLTGLYGAAWSEAEIDVASGEFYRNCVIDKGSDGFILIIGPIVALLGGVICTLTMFSRFHAPPWPDIGVNLLLIAAILLLVGFWSISISTSTEIFNSYTYCGDAQAPLMYQGRWYDQTPCIDADSLSQSQWNPFVVILLSIDSTYIAGGVFSILASLIFLGLVTGFSEKMMTDRMGKWLVSVAEYTTPRLPFPSRRSGN